MSAPFASIFNLRLLAQMPEQEPPSLPHPEIPPPPVIDPGLPWWSYVLGGMLIAAVLALLVYLLFGRKAKQAEVVKHPLADAIKRLKALRNKADVMEPSEVGHEVSAILRRYYMERYGIPAPFKTTQELFPQVSLNDEPMRRRMWRTRFESLASLYDSLSYAPLPATRNEAAGLVDQAIEKLEEERLAGGGGGATQ